MALGCLLPGRPLCVAVVHWASATQFKTRVGSVSRPTGCRHRCSLRSDQNAEGIRQFQPRVSTLGNKENDTNSETVGEPSCVLANTLGV